MQKATLIYNPLAGPANLAVSISLVADQWQTHGWDVSVIPTEAAGHATQLAEQAVADGIRLVIAAGGDGTLGEVANGLAGTETVMAPLPVGTGNSFAKELLMPRPNLLNRHKLFAASESLALGKVHRMDLGYTDHGDGKGRYWLLWAGTGADGFLVHEMEPRPKWSKKLGPFGYLLQGMTVAPRFPKMWAKVDIDGRIYEDEYILLLISNSRLYGGGELLLSPEAKLDDGLFEVWLFKGTGMAQLTQFLWQIKVGQHLDNPDAEMIHGRSITIHTEPQIGCHTDGDKAGQTPLTCHIKPGALHLLVPNTAPPDLFGQAGQPLSQGL